jgi:hypothetical protein
VVRANTDKPNVSPPSPGKPCTVLDGKQSCN